MKFGYIGLGNMGGAIAKRMLLTQELIVFDLSEKIRNEFAKLGAQTASTISEIGVKADSPIID